MKMKDYMMDLEEMNEYFQKEAQNNIKTQLDNTKAGATNG